MKKQHQLYYCSFKINASSVLLFYLYRAICSRLLIEVWHKAFLALLQYVDYQYIAKCALGVKKKYIPFGENVYTFCLKRIYLLVETYIPYLKVDKETRKQVDKKTSGQEDKWTKRQVNGFAGKKGINFNVQEDSGKDNPSEGFIGFLL